MSRKISGYVVAGIVVVLDLFFMWQFRSEFQSWVVLIPSIGILTFFGVMMTANLFSKNNDLQKGEMRISIAASLLVVYFLLVSVTLFAGRDVSPLRQFNQENQCSEETQNCPENATTVNDILKGTLDNYTSLIVVVVAFYFGGRSVEEAAKTIKDAIVKKDRLAELEKAAEAKPRETP